MTIVDAWCLLGVVDAWTCHVHTRVHTLVQPVSPLLLEYCNGSASWYGRKQVLKPYGTVDSLVKPFFLVKKKTAHGRGSDLWPSLQSWICNCILAETGNWRSLPGKTQMAIFSSKWPGLIPQKGMSLNPWKDHVKLPNGSLGRIWGGEMLLSFGGMKRHET